MGLPGAVRRALEPCLHLFSVTTEAGDAGLLPFPRLKDRSGGKGKCQELGVAVSVCVKCEMSVSLGTGGEEETPGGRQPCCKP